MCAINPVHKKRFVIDVYTSDRTFTKEEFENKAIEVLLSTEIELNSSCSIFRFHLKESNQEAD